MDFEKLINEMTKAVISVVGTKAAESGSFITGAIARRKARLERIANMLINKEIEEYEFDELIENEKELLKSQLETVAIITAATIQEATNAAMEVFTTTVKTTLKLLL